MRLKGRYWRSGKFWLAEIPLLDAMTQGHTRRELFEMVVDLVETLVNRPGFSAQVHPGGEGEFELSASDVQALLGLVLRRQRERSGLSLAEVAERMGARSRNAYARYERANVMPSLAKLSELIQAVAPGSDLVLAESRILYQASVRTAHIPSRRRRETIAPYDTKEVSRT